jgi:putative ubiquitin-RnfH superfamily antitoxin RatB of RatAB toxin-antitoxin module
MRVRDHLLIILMACLAYSGVAQDKAQPRIKFDETEYSFGVISGTVPFLAHDFTFRNEGKGVLEILRLEDSCNCFVSTISQRSLKPGESGRISVKLLVKHILERASEPEISRAITVYTNDPAHPKVQLSLYVEVQKPFVLDPKVLRFGSVGAGTSAEKTLEILPQLAPISSHRVVAIEPSVEYLEVKWQAVAPTTAFTTPTAELTPAQRKAVLIKMLGKYDAVVRLKPNAPEGTFTGFLTVRTNVSEQNTIQVAVHGEVTGKIAVFPDRVFFGIIDAGKAAKRIVTISGAGRDLKISRVEQKLGYIKLDPPRAVGDGTYEIGVEVSPEENRAGAFEDTLVLHTNIKEKPRIEITAYGVIRGKVKK